MAYPSALAPCRKAGAEAGIKSEERRVKGEEAAYGLSVRPRTVRGRGTIACDGGGGVRAAHSFHRSLFTMKAEKWAQKYQAPCSRVLKSNEIRITAGILVVVLGLKRILFLIPKGVVTQIDVFRIFVDFAGIIILQGNHVAFLEKRQDIKRKTLVFHEMG